MTSPVATKLRRLAERQLRNRKKTQGPEAAVKASAADNRRLLHELQVHQIELEMQNAELQTGREEIEMALEKYSDLYEFAPVGYFTISEQGEILEANLRGTVLLGIDRSRLIGRRLQSVVAASSRADFANFLEKVFTGSGKQTCETPLLKSDGDSFWADIQAVSATSRTLAKCCRVVISDVTAIKRGEEAKRRAAELAASNLNLQREIERRQGVEEVLRKSEQHQIQLLEQSRHMQEELRHLSRQLLAAQEEERKKISRELHDEIAQTLTGINVRLSLLKADVSRKAKGLQSKVASAQRLVEKSVDIVHRFAQDLRPPVLDDLGLIPALHSFAKRFLKETGIHVNLTVFPGVEKMSSAKRTAFYRVAQEALTNVARHAHASRVEVSIQKLPKAVCMTIKDDGQAFEVERLWSGRGRRHLGLLGMRERMEMVGGSFGVDSLPSQGTTITAQIPFGKGSQGEC